ncbi:MAG: T9SS type A sorting domain-containing protein [Flavobacteriales bacterium]|nr:T9SS type A sorting domain-containing protein [Flavobacteriales bacterium]
MKHITLGALLLIGATSMNAQVFTSDLESWTDGLPDGFVGARNNLSTDSIFQETNNPHSGSSAVRLQLSTGTHKRFTTVAQSVTAGASYDITFWVRGTGSIRTGIYDGRPTGSGYAAYNDYVELVAADWQEVTQTVSAEMTTAEAEFILSILGTVGPDHLVVDDVTISDGVVVPPTEATIYEIQYTEDTSGDSPLMNTNVITMGIVTGAKAGTGYFLQDGTGPWNGIFVNDATNAPVRGDLVEVTASVQENFGFTRLTGVSAFMVMSSGNAEPAPEVLDPTSASQEQWESVLVTVPDVECTGAPNNFAEWPITNWLGSMLVDDVLYEYTPTVGAFYNVTGPTQYAFSAWRVLPRDVNDVSVGSGVTENFTIDMNIFPNPATDLMRVTLPAGTGRAQLFLMDAAGRMVMNDVNATDRAVLNVRDLANGVYLLTVRTEAGISTERISVQH